MKKLLLFLLLLGTSPAFSQHNPGEGGDKDSEILNLSSPYYALYTFLANLQDDHYHPEISAKVFLANDGKSAERYAIQLKQILDGEGIYVALDDVPRELDFYDSAVHKRRYIITSQYPGIYLEKVNGDWVFKGNTLQRISDTHNDVFAFGMSYLLDLLPAAGTKKFAGLGIWQIIACLLYTSDAADD